MAISNAEKPMVAEKEPEKIDIDGLQDRKLGESLEKPRLDGKVVTIVDCELAATGQIHKSKDGQKDIETVLFKVHYLLEDKSRAYENYGGVQRFIRPDGSRSEPTIWTDGKSWSSKLFRRWLDHKKKKAEDVSFKDFFKSLKEDKMKVRLTEVTATYQGNETIKNVVEIFL